MNWRKAALRSAAEVHLGRQRSPEHAQGPNMTRYLRAANVTDGALNLDGVLKMNFSPKEQELFSLRTGDVLVTEGSGSIGTVGASAVYRSELPGTVCFQNTLLRLRPRAGCDGRFLAWWARSAYASGRFASIAGGANIFHLSAERVRGLPIDLPPLEDQRRIADFLDAETSRIDRLQEGYERFRSLVCDRERSVIDGLIRASADLVPFRYWVRYREGPGIMAADFHDTGTPLIRISGLRDGRVTLNGCNYLDPALVASKWKQFRIRMGDYVISGSATMGEVSVVSDAEVIGSIPYTGLIILRPAASWVNMEFVATFLRSAMFEDQIDQLKAGAAMQHFGPTHLSQVRMPVFSPQEQRVLCNRAGLARRQAQRARDLVDRQLALLAERRQALITAAVTGQLDVTTARSGVRV